VYIQGEKKQTMCISCPGKWNSCLSAKTDVQKNAQR